MFVYTSFAKRGQKNYLPITFLLIGFILLGFSNISAQNGWTLISDMQTFRAGAGACVINDSIYVTGGISGYPGTYWDVDVNEIFNPLDLTWKVKNAMPTARGLLYTGIINKTIYAIGGGYTLQCDTNEAYDTETDSWTTKSCLPIQCSGMAGAVVDGKIYIMGGSSVNKCYQYDPATDIWTEKNSLPEDGCAGYLAAAAYNGLIYTFGGSISNDSALSAVCVYNPQTNTWVKKIENMPTPRYASGAYLINDKIYVIGGSRTESTAVTAVEVYDTENDVWESLPDMPVELSFFAGTTYNNQVYIFGGTADWVHGGEYVWKFDPRMVGVEQISEVPNSFELYQNYPNPFNPSTRIKYQVSSISHVSLVVYDILGNEIATLVNEEKPAGTYEVEFNASITAGGVSAKSGYASGVYFYQIKAGDFTQTKKMILEK